MKNKGQISSLSPIILTLVVIGVLLCVGMMILAAMQSATYVSTAATVVNESLARPTTTGISLATGAAAQDGVCGAVTALMNGTSGAGLVIGLGNITQTGCLVMNATDWGVNGLNASTNIRYSYPYTFNDNSATSTALGTVNTSLGTLASTWIPIIVIVIAAALVIGILMGAFGKKRM